MINTDTPQSHVGKFGSEVCCHEIAVVLVGGSRILLREEVDLQRYCGYAGLLHVEHMSRHSHLLVYAANIDSNKISLEASLIT